LDTARVIRTIDAGAVSRGRGSPASIVRLTRAQHHLASSENLHLGVHLNSVLKPGLQAPLLAVKEVRSLFIFSACARFHFLRLSLPPGWAHPLWKTNVFCCCLRHNLLFARNCMFCLCTSTAAFNDYFSFFLSLFGNSLNFKGSSKANHSRPIIKISTTF